jgi:hypothetical protein
MLSVQLLNQLRELAPIMDLRGISKTEWVERAGTNLITLARYLDWRTSVGDEDTITALLDEVTCHIVVQPDGPLSTAWTEKLRQVMEARSPSGK